VTLEPNTPRHWKPCLLKSFASTPREKLALPSRGGRSY
jgi:hypothetical protein